MRFSANHYAIATLSLCALALVANLVSLFCEQPSAIGKIVTEKHHKDAGNATYFWLTIDGEVYFVSYDVWAAQQVGKKFNPDPRPESTE